MQPIVEFSHVTMDFPGIRANDDISLSIRKGEIFALVGENGAGKSTLMNILYGILTPTAGQVRIKGETIFSSPQPVSVVDVPTKKVYREIISRHRGMNI